MIPSECNECSLLECHYLKLGCSHYVSHKGQGKGKPRKQKFNYAPVEYADTREYQRLYHRAWRENRFPDKLIVIQKVQIKRGDLTTIKHYAEENGILWNEFIAKLITDEAQKIRSEV